MTSKELDCRVFVETDRPLEDVARLLAQSCDGHVSGSHRSRTVRTVLGEIDVRLNEESDSRRVVEFPDGFLFFRYALEVYPSPAVAHEERVAFTANMLRALWSSGSAAVAVSDYEPELPHRGGYKSPSVPWPSPRFASEKEPVATNR